MLHFFDSVWKDVSASTAAIQSVIPKCRMPNGDVIGVSVMSSMEATENGGSSRSRSMMRMMKSRRGRERERRRLHKAKKHKSGSMSSKISGTTSSSTPQATIVDVGDGTVTVDFQLPPCNFVGQGQGGDGKNDETAAMTAEDLRCKQIADNVDDNTDSETMPLTMTYTVFSDATITETDLNNLQRFFQKVVGPRAAGCQVDTSGFVYEARGRVLQQNNELPTTLEDEKSEIRRISFEKPNVIAADQGGMYTILRSDRIVSVQM